MYILAPLISIILHVYEKNSFIVIWPILFLKRGGFRFYVRIGGSNFQVRNESSRPDLKKLLESLDIQKSFLEIFVRTPSCNTCCVLAKLWITLIYHWCNLYFLVFIFINFPNGRSAISVSSGSRESWNVCNIYLASLILRSCSKCYKVVLKQIALIFCALFNISINRALLNIRATAEGTV